MIIGQGLEDDVLKGDEKGMLELKLLAGTIDLIGID